jgi:hypothetical protein
MPVTVRDAVAMWVVVAAGSVALLCSSLAGWILLARRRVARGALVFRCTVRAVTPGGGRTHPRWPRRTMYGEWVHDVLIVHSGLFLGAGAAFPVRFPEGVISPILDAPARIHQAVALRLRLDDGGIVQVATYSMATERLAGPYLAVAVLAADAEVLRHRGR